jgi:protein-disulfide isomerase-like protein with CxxC motif
MQLPPLEAIDTSGTAVTVRFDDTATPTVLYVLNPSCSWCLRNRDAIADLYRTRKGQYRFVGISLGRLASGGTDEGHDAPFPVYMASPASTILYRLGATPQTLLVSNTGEVQAVWNGAYFGSTGQAIKHHFGVELPPVLLPSRPADARQ